MGRRVHRRGAGGHGRGYGDAGPPLILFGNGTFTRSSDASFQPTTETVVNVGPNIMRRENGLYLCEGPRTNLVVQNSQIGTAPWAAGVASSASENAAASPDGSFSADQLTMDGTTSLGRTQSVTLTAATYAGSVWIKAASGGEIGKSWRYRYGNGGGNPANGFSGTLPAAWTRFSAQGTQVAAGATQAFESRVNEPVAGDPALAAYTSYVWGHQNELGRFPSSLIYTTTAAATRAADVLTFATGTYPTRLLDGRWAFWIEPEGTSAEFLDVAYWWSFGAAADINYIRWNGSGTIQVVQGAAVKISKSITWTSRFQRILLILDCAAGTLEVRGATTGDGVTAGTAFAWPGSLRLNVGMREDLVGQCFCRISEPYAA